MLNKLKKTNKVIPSTTQTSKYATLTIPNTLYLDLVILSTKANMSLNDYLTKVVSDAKTKAAATTTVYPFIKQ